MHGHLRVKSTCNTFKFALVWQLCEFLEGLIYLGLYLDTVCVCVCVCVCTVYVVIEGEVLMGVQVHFS